MHPRNRHKGQYDLQKLIASNPDLKKFVFNNQFGNETVDFADAKAVRALNLALLKSWYNLNFWSIPDKFLCPPIPGRADYIHYVSDIFNNPKDLRVLDIGTGANLIYPIIGHAEYGWKMVGSDINQEALKVAETIINENSLPIELRLQNNRAQIFEGIIRADERFDLTVCNPPFHSSREEAERGTERKWRNLGKGNKKDLNFSGSKDELWCEGGEKEFIHKMILESERFKGNVQFFSTLVSKEKNLAPLESLLKKLKADHKIISYGHGNKQTRILAWTFRQS